MKKITNIITQAEFARKLKQQPQFITKLIDAGVIHRRPDGRLDYAESLAKAQAYLKARSEADALHAGKTALAAKKLSLQCELLQAELDQVRGKVHSKEACCQSLTQIVSAISHELLALGSQIRTQFPEVSPAIVSAIDAAIDEKFRRLKSGLAYRGTYHCPKCAAVIDEIRLETLPEDKQP